MIAQTRIMPNCHSGEGRNPVKYFVQSTQNQLLCPSDAYLNWIPAFAGMTARYLIASQEM
jgi:hypothetical protein